MPLPLLIPAIGAGVSLATQALGAIPGKYQKEQKKRLGILDDDLAAGRGLDAGEAQTMMNTSMAPVRSQTGSMASELARLQAASGGLGGGAQAAAARDSMARTTGLAAERVGSRVAAANQDALYAKQDERAGIMAAQAERRRSMFEGVTRTLGDTLGAYGALAGGPQAAGLMNKARKAAAPAAPAAAAPAAAPARQPSASDITFAPSAPLPDDASMARQAALRQMEARIQRMIESGVDPAEARRMAAISAAAGPYTTTPVSVY